MKARTEPGAKLAADATFFPVADRGGFLKFTVQELKEDLGGRGVANYQYFNAEIWVAQNDPLIGQLTKGLEVDIIGKWDVSKRRAGDGIVHTYHTFKVLKREDIKFKGQDESH